MRIKLTATIVSLLLFGSAGAATINGCELLSPAEVERLGVPKGATANSSTNDGKYLCGYAVNGTIVLTVSFGKASDGIVQATKERTARAKTSASGAESKSHIDAAFDDSSLCGSSIIVPNAQVISCWGIKNAVLLDMLIMHGVSSDPKIEPAAPYLQFFNEVLTRVSTKSL